jgi:hypothetical protein
MKQYGSWARRRRLPAADAGHDDRRESRDRDLRDLALDEGARQGTEGAGDGAVAVESLARAAAEQAAGDVGSSRIGRDRTGCRRDPVHLSRRGLQPETQDKGTAEIIIGKQRNGPIGMVRLTFLGEYTRFESFTKTGHY